MHAEDAHIVSETVFGTSWTSVVSILSVGPMFIFAITGTGTIGLQKERRRELWLICLTGSSFHWRHILRGQNPLPDPLEPYLVVLSPCGLKQVWLALARVPARRLAPDGEST